MAFIEKPDYLERNGNDRFIKNNLKILNKSFTFYEKAFP
jgi:hypothetical protein